MAKSTKAVEVPKEELITEKAQPETAVEVAKEEKTTEQLVADFVSKQKGEYSLNDFLKTLPKKHETVTHLKQLGGILTKLNVKVKGNAHLQLGKNYYDPSTLKQLHYGLDDIEIIAEK